MLKSVTIDTGVWIEILDKKDPSKFDDATRLLDVCRDHSIDIWASSRVQSLDTRKMNVKQRDELSAILHVHSRQESSYFRFDISSLDGPDYCLSALGINPREAEFTRVVGRDPTCLPEVEVGKRRNNKIGDYDALMHHYLHQRDIFVTWDTKDYLHVSRRGEYLEKLGLRICNPKQATDFIEGVCWMC